MLVELTGNGDSKKVELNNNQSDFKVTLQVLVKDGFDGKATVQYSLNGEDWFPVEEMGNLTADKTGNLFFPVCYVRLVVVDMTTGKALLYVLQGA